MMEQFIPGFEGKYSVDIYGNVYSYLRKNKIKLSPGLRGKTNLKYQYVMLTSDKYKMKAYSVHRLVAETFLDNPLNLPQVDHIDGNPLNNCLRNLQWISNRHNCIKSFGKIYRFNYRF